MRPRLAWTVCVSLSVVAAVVAVSTHALLRVPELPTPFNLRDTSRDAPPAAAYDRVAPAWRHTHSVAVREAVLQDVLVGHDPGITICVGVQVETDDPRTPSPMNDAPTPGWRTTVDAPLELRRRLASIAHDVLPYSRCHLNDEDAIVDHNGHPAAEVAVGPISWVSETFVKTDAYRLRGGFWGSSFSYTLSLRDGGWRPDRVVLTGVS